MNTNWKDDKTKILILRERLATMYQEVYDSSLEESLEWADWVIRNSIDFDDDYYEEVDPDLVS